MREQPLVLPNELAYQLRCAVEEIFFWKTGCSGNLLQVVLEREDEVKRVAHIPKLLFKYVPLSVDELLGAIGWQSQLVHRRERGIRRWHRFYVEVLAKPVGGTANAVVRRLS